MCRRFVALSYDDVLEMVVRIEAGLPLTWEPDWPARSFEAFPNAGVPVVVPSSAPEGAGMPRLAVEELTWGYPVEWRRGPVFNTRIETALAPGRTMWSASFERGRCLVPALAFHESHATETVPSVRTGRPVKRQYRFSLPGGEAMLLAGVQEDGRFSLVTTEPNACVAAVHDRMPLVLRADEAQAWLEGDCALLVDRSGIGLVAAAEDGQKAATGIVRDAAAEVVRGRPGPQGRGSREWARRPALACSDAFASREVGRGVSARPGPIGLTGPGQESRSLFRPFSLSMSLR